MDIFASYATDKNKENTGTWVKVGDAEFLIARSNNRKFAKMLGEKLEENRLALDTKDEAAEAMSDKLMGEVISETIMLDWRGNVSYMGKPLKYSKANAQKVLAHRDFRALILTQADNIDNFKMKQEDEDVKNSPSA